MKRRIVLLGPPASGKSTQAEMISARFQIPRVSPGALLRDEARAQSEIGLQAEQFTKDGKLVPDEIICSVVQAWLERHDSEFIFDGFPRSLFQAEDLEAQLGRRGLGLETVILLEIEKPALVGRVMSRVVCLSCGSSFSVGIHIPSSTSPCPNCGGVLGRRGDDSLEVLEQRLREYAQTTEPLVDYYLHRNLLARVDSTESAADVFVAISEVLLSA